MSGAGLPAQSDVDGVDTQTLECFCLFIGNPRSGTTLLASLLDAHPSIIISNELHVLNWLVKYPGRTFAEWAAVICEKSRQDAQLGKTWNDYSYRIEEGWQGRWETLRVLGDKMSAHTALALEAQPGLLEQLEKVIPVPIKFLHMIRNPYDSIATIATKRHAPLDDKIRSYFSVIGTATRLSQSRRIQCVEIHLADLIAHPSATLKGVCEFLGQTPSPDYLQACSALVFDDVRTTRTSVDWTRDQVRTVQEQCAQYACLRRYSFDDAST